jgi:uncharacterized membrane protein
LFFYLSLLQAVLALSIRVHGASLEGLGADSNGTTNNWAFAISWDGKTAVGSMLTTNGRRAFRWTKTEGIRELGGLPSDIVKTEATAVSADGSTIVGRMNASRSPVEGFVWTSQTGLRPLGRITVGRFTEATKVSADGRTIVGMGDNEFYKPRGIVWRDMVMNVVDSGAQETTLKNVSQDGRTVFGFASDSYLKNERPFSWVGQSNFSYFPMPGGTYARVTTCSQSGSSWGIAIPRGGDYHAAAWLARQELRLLPEGFEEVSGSSVSAVPDSGNFQVGYVNFKAGGSQAVIWWQNTVQSLEILLRRSGVNLTGWQLTSAAGISGDETRIVGGGLHNGIPEAYIATIDKNLLDPSVVITRSGNKFQASWKGLGQLQQSDLLGGGWANIATSTNHYAGETDTFHRFFRVLPPQ